jgi:hypothetical protein
VKRLFLLNAAFAVAILDLISRVNLASFVASYIEGTDINYGIWRTLYYVSVYIYVFHSILDFIASCP